MNVAYRVVEPALLIWLRSCAVSKTIILVALSGLVLLSSLADVTLRYQQRQQFLQLAVLQQQWHTFHVEQSKLKIEYATLLVHSRLAKRAKSTLNMRHPHAAVLRSRG